MSYRWSAEDTRQILEVEAWSAESELRRVPGPDESLRQGVNDLRAAALVTDLPESMVAVEVNPATEEPFARTKDGTAWPPEADQTQSRDEQRFGLEQREYAALKWLDRAGYGDQIGRLRELTETVKARHVPLRRSTDPILRWDRLTEAPQTEPPEDVAALAEAIDDQLPAEAEPTEPLNLHEMAEWRYSRDQHADMSPEAHYNQWHLAVGRHPRQQDQAAVVVAETADDDGKVTGYELRTLETRGEVVGHFTRDVATADIAREVAHTYGEVMANHERAEQRRVALNQMSHMNIAHSGPGQSAPGL